MNAHKIYKPKPVSGFPEWLPQIRRVEQRWLDHIRKIFESYGYASIETPSVEELDVITAKGEDVDKEIYVLERLQKQEGDTKEARLALHFDQTVPLARYVAQHFNDLTFPFKRYQMQKVWRGERPQAGRFREFYQCDIDVITVDNLPIHFDAEMPAIIWKILTALPGMENEKIQLRISNRKILFGLLEALNITNTTDVTSLIDKLAKIGEREVEKNLSGKCGLDNMQIGQIMTIVKTRDIKSIKPLGPKMEEGLKELNFVMDQLTHIKNDGVMADLSIVRGLDYYTGTVYETVFLDDPNYGSICSGGRYDDLAGNYINKHLPGVGISIGFTRLFDRLRQKNLLPQLSPSPTHALIILIDESQRAAAAAKAQELRTHGLNIEMFHAPSKIQKQFSYAEKKGIPFVLVPMDDAARIWEIKNMQDRTQKPETEGLADIKTYAKNL